MSWSFCSTVNWALIASHRPLSPSVVETTVSVMHMTSVSPDLRLASYSQLWSTAAPLLLPDYTAWRMCERLARGPAVDETRACDLLLVS